MSKWVLLGSSALLTLVLATGCQSLRQTRHVVAHALPTTPTLTDVVTVANDNSAKIRTLYSTDATVHIPMAPALRANLALERPRRLRMPAETGLTGPEIDLGSNDALFWAWIRRMEPPTTFYCRHEQFAASPLRQMVPIDPDWLVEALGVSGFDPAGQNTGPFPVRKGRIEIRTQLSRPEGAMTKITVLDAQRAWVLEQHWYDPRGTRFATSLTSDHWRDPESGAVVPRKIELQWPSAQLSVKLDLKTVAVNRLGGDPTLLFELPEYPGSGLVDMGNPTFRPPLLETSTAQPVLAAPPRRYRLFR